MAIDIRMPNITATSEAGQLLQIKSYLYQFSEQLNWALNTLESNGEISVVNQSKGGSSSSGSSAFDSDASSSSEENKEASFTELKSLIIKSADIVNAYYEKINTKLKGQYIAVSDFGTYYNNASLELKGTCDGLVQNYSSVQGTLNGLKEKIAELENDAHIKTGLLKYEQIGEQDGIPIYGMQVGQTTENEEGEEVFNRLAQYSTLGVELYDSQNTTKPSSYLHKDEMMTTNAIIKGKMELGGYRADTSNGVAWKWVGFTEEEEV